MEIWVAAIVIGVLVVVYLLVSVKQARDRDDGPGRR
jgi:hypothetical protein